MIVDHRVYTVRPTRVADWVALYREKGYPLQERYLGRCVGWYVPVEGRHDQVVHLWAYEDQADRERRRAALYADPEWQAYLAEMKRADLLLAMENRILAPTDFSPVP
ncbi:MULTISPECIES: NIPSNAP family protein [Streptomyces]|uniref:NIPSNAP family protein n=1 Tax=Streptomyces TaxID=1883 RepID=UPI001F3891CF|nr:NIPSNAP family protein [Streptomyces sp. A1-5]UJB40578.1 NIPSNAP family protein [Streptomyces sp. A1-5]